MAYTKRIEFGNFTLKFGEDRVLLDFLDEIVWPSFIEREYIRSLQNKSSYFFLDTKVMKFADDGKDDIAIVGRIVKNTKIARDQIYRGGNLILDKRELSSAPSSVFVLLLASHRLLFCREMSNAPSIQNFDSTCSAFLNQRRLEFIQEIYNATAEAEEGGKAPRGLKTQLLKQIPKPRLRITPLSDQKSLAEFVKRFKSIDQLTIKLLPTNHEEIDNDDFWKDLQRRRESINSDTATVRFGNRSEGLNPAEVVAQTRAATALANSEVSLRGHDAAGDSIRGNNEDFSLTVPIEQLSSHVNDAATVMYHQFRHVAQTGLMLLPNIGQEIFRKVNDFFDSL